VLLERIPALLSDRRADGQTVEFGVVGQDAPQLNAFCPLTDGVKNLRHRDQLDLQEGQYDFILDDAGNGRPFGRLVKLSVSRCHVVLGRIHGHRRVCVKVRLFARVRFGTECQERVGIQTFTGFPGRLVFHPAFRTAT